MRSEHMALDALISVGRRLRLFDPDSCTSRVDIGRRDIERLVPHRDPFLFVDRISAVDLEQRKLVAHRTVDPRDPVFEGHFPGEPVWPGALLVEAIGQAGACLHCLCSTGRTEVAPNAPVPRIRLLRVHHALFMAEILPGDEVVLLSRQVDDTGLTATYAGQVLKGGVPCALAISEVVLLDD